jgi:hypothetical protein
MIGGAFSPELFVLIPIITLLLIGLGCITMALVPALPQMEAVEINEPALGQLYNTRSKHHSPGFPSTLD